MRKNKGFTPHLLWGQKQDKVSLTPKKGVGFTLIELLIVVAILSILAAIVYVAVDPARRLAEARNAERWGATNAVLNAVLKYTVDNAGTLPANLLSATVDTYYVLGKGGIGSCPDVNCQAVVNNTDCLDLSGDLVDRYISAIPKDPSSGSDDNTDYYIMKSSAGRIKVGACDPERGIVISVAR